MKRHIVRWTVMGMLVAAFHSVSELRTQAQAMSCYNTRMAAVCFCPLCLYSVVCGLQVGAVPSISVSICDGTNPGFVVASCGPASQGLDSTTATTVYTCGTALLIGRCCGGARSTVLDLSWYSYCTPAGRPCGGNGPGTINGTL
jgi:hypothetical protein